MQYEEYIDKFRNAIFAGIISSKEKSMNEQEFELFVSDIKTKELKDDPEFRLSYKEIYLRLRKIVMNWSDSLEKEQYLRELDEEYQKVSKKLNL